MSFDKTVLRKSSIVCRCFKQTADQMLQRVNDFSTKISLCGLLGIIIFLSQTELVGHLFQQLNALGQHLREGDQLSYAKFMGLS